MLAVFTGWLIGIYLIPITIILIIILAIFMD